MKCVKINPRQGGKDAWASAHEHASYERARLCVGKKYKNKNTCIMKIPLQLVRYGFIYLLIHLFFAVKRKNCGVQSRRNIVHGWVNKRIPWMYANVNYLVNAWVSGNINELFSSRLSSFLFFLILEKKKYLKVREKIQTKL